MDPKVFKVLHTNRVRILTLDYYDLTAILLSKDILPTWKHKEIKTEAKTDKARIDGLLDWLEECNIPQAFPAFLEGVKNCKEGHFAKRLKKEAEGVYLGPMRLGPVPVMGSSKPKFKPKVDNKMKPPLSKPGIGPGGGSGINAAENGMKKFPTPGGFPGDIKPKIKVNVNKPKLKPATSQLDFSFLNDLTSIATPTPKDKNKTDKPKTPKIQKPKTPMMSNSTGTSVGTNDPLSASSNQIIKKTPGPAANKTPTANKPPTAATKQNKVTLPKSLQGSPFKTKRKLTKLEKAMTFEEVVEKQKNARQKFNFSNNAAVAKEFQASGSIFYEGCSFKTAYGICSKKVEKKGGEYVCKEEHKTDQAFMIPRINAIFTDGTADLELTFFKQDVEALVGISQPDLLKLDPASIHFACTNVISKNFHVEVECTKLDKRESKKFGGKRWNNVSTILLDDEPGMKKKK